MIQPAAMQSLSVDNGRKTAELVAQIDSPSAKESSEINAVPQDEGPKPCGVSESTVPDSPRTCSEIITSHVDVTPCAEQNGPAAEPSEADHPDVSLIPAGVPDKKSGRPIRKRKLKSTRPT